MAGAKTPMEYEQIGKVLARAMKDKSFRDNLVGNPADALKDEDFEPGPITTEFFKSLKDKDFDEAAERYKSRRDAIGGAGDG